MAVALEAPRVETEFIAVCSRAGGRPLVSVDREECVFEYERDYVRVRYYPKVGKMWIEMGRREDTKPELAAAISMRDIKAVEAPTPERMWITAEGANVTVTKEAKVHLDVV
jgi:hypothetical protein